MSDELKRRYLSAAHGMQSGVAMRLGRDELNGVPVESRESGPKHLRTGINSAMADHAALVKLLISKKIITDEEYLETIVEMMEIERDRYAEELSAEMGVKITLG